MVKSLVKNLVSWQLVKYVCVGFLGTGLDFVILYILVEYGHIHYLTAAVLSVSIILWLSFSLNKFWTFNNHEKKYFAQFGKYILFHLIALVLGLTILTVLVEIFHLWYLYAKFFATVVAALTNFINTKKYIFFEKQSEPAK